MDTLTFARRLQALRTQRGLTQQDLADRLGVARSTVATYECGSREPCHQVTQRIAELLETTTDYLLGCSCASRCLPTAADEVLAEILQEVARLPKHDQRDILMYVRFRRQQAGQES